MPEPNPAPQPAIRPAPSEFREHAPRAEAEAPPQKPAISLLLKAQPVADNPAPRPEPQPNDASADPPTQPPDVVLKGGPVADHAPADADPQPAPAPAPEPVQQSSASPAPPPVAAPEPRPAARPEPPPAEAPPPARPLETDIAEVDRREDRTHFRIVLRDDRLGRVSLNLTERAGLIDLMVRADKGVTVRTLQSAMPALIDALAQRQLSAEPLAYAPHGATDSHDPQQERDRRERRAHDARPRIRARRVVGSTAAAAQ